ncbi:DUF4838 domain-containing protein [Kribbella sp. NPDC050459]|uniref:DUF4838 domain-containing protein n=1 Tax=Kribbella sp. NPDC050459 TaxID=3155785 RepID=UPI0033F5E0A2
MVHGISRRAFVGGVTAVSGAALLSSTNAWALPEETLALVENRQARAVIVLAAEASASEKLAAEEIRSHLELITGTSLAVTTGSAPADLTPIYIGGAVPAPRLETIRAGGEDPGALRLTVTRTHVEVIGLGDEGTLYAGYELLEQLGVRWLVPQAVGTFVPSLDTIRLRIQETIQHPAIRSRNMALLVKYTTTNNTEAADWARRNRLGGPNYYTGQSIPLLPAANPNTEPELFQIQPNGTRSKQLDVTHPEVLRRAVAAARAKLTAEPNLRYLSMNPLDGSGFGVSEWDANDWDPASLAYSVTDRYIKFYNLVLEQLEPDYPEVGIMTLAYYVTMRPPVREVPNPKIMPVFAPITVERLHHVNNTLSWERHAYLQWVVDGWKEAGVREVGNYSYYYNLADPGLAFSVTPQIRNEVPYLKSKGAAYFLPEVLPAWAYQGAGLYLATKLLWADDVDPERVLDDYYEGVYGPAADVVRQHFATLESAFESADRHNGHVLDYPTVFTTSVLDKLEASLGRAEEVTASLPDERYAVRMLRLVFDFTKHVLNAMNRYQSFDFVAAQAELTQGVTLAKEASTTKPVALSPFAVRYYFSILLEPIITQGAQRQSNGNRAVATLPDRWLTRFDPDGIGLAEGFWKPGIDISGWRELQTRDSTLGDQGGRYYHGWLWQRADFTLEEDDGPLRLWLAGIDGYAEAWLNGEPLPKIAGYGGGPWEFGASTAARWGRSNTLVIAVQRSFLNELGTGGILGPSMLWTGPLAAPSAPPLAPSKLAAELTTPPRTAEELSPVPSGPYAGPSIAIENGWRIFLDPDANAVELGLVGAGLGNTSWLPVSLRKSWRDQGLENYTGHAVYRNSFRVGPEFGERGILRLSAAGGLARCWINGTELSLVSPGGVRAAWQFRVADTLRIGQPNDLAIWVGDGGLAGPVEIYRS